ncbi:MAG TPA: sensor histidine kinase [Verrucomicrobiae bacterium]|nr:sensor histidine kinase [Verrucomicrobiae bacterium]
MTLIALGLVSVGALGVVDYITGPETSLSLYCILPVVFSTWLAGPGAGALLAVVCATGWMISDLLLSVELRNPYVPVWDAILHLSLYLIVVWLVTALRKLKEHMEAQVQERATALTAALHERERLQKELAEKDERQRQEIGRDLHDGLCQQLTAMMFACKVLEERLAEQSLPEAGTAGELVSSLGEAIDQTRDLARGFYPVILDTGSLCQALEELASRVQRQFRVSCLTEIPAPVPVSNKQFAAQLYRIAQEAATNAAKHGRCDRITIRLSETAGRISLAIVDDGDGIPAAFENKPGMGLSILRQRAAAIGAIVEIRGNRGRGTTVECSLPREPSQ